MVLEAGRDDICLARDSVMQEASIKSRDSLAVLHAELQVALTRCRVKLLSTIPSPRTCASSLLGLSSHESFLYPLGPVESSKKPSYLEEAVKEREKKLAEWEKVSLLWCTHPPPT